MAFSINKAIVLGAAGNDASAKVTPGGTHVTEFSLATSYGVKQQDGSYKNTTTWHNCVAFGKSAETLAAIKKGQKVYVDGRTETQTWDDRHTGEKRYKDRIIVNEFVLLTEKDETTQSTISPTPRYRAQTATQAAQEFSRQKQAAKEETDPSIPF